MSNSSTLETVREHLARANARQASVYAEYQRAVAEVNELKATEKTLMRLFPEPVAIETASNAVVVEVSVPATGKPSDIPPVPAMILEALMASDGPADSREIKQFISHRYWSSVTAQDLAPRIWRMKQNGRIVQDAKGRYSLPKNETPAGETAGASGPGGLSGPLLESTLSRDADTQKAR